MTGWMGRTWLDRIDNAGLDGTGPDRMRHGWMVGHDWIGWDMVEVDGTSPNWMGQDRIGLDMV